MYINVCMYVAAITVNKSLRKHNSIIIIIEIEVHIYKDAYIQGILSSS